MYTLAVTMGVMWEILEFNCDMLLGTANRGIKTYSPFASLNCRAYSSFAK